MAKSKENRALRLALGQINPTVGDLCGNASKICRTIASAKEAGADLVVLPEQALPGYPAEDLLLKKQFVADNLCQLKELAGVARGITAIVGFVESGKQGAIHNAAAVLQAGKVQKIYRKIHLPNYGVFDEKRYFAPGKGTCLLRLKGQKVAVNICEDIWEAGPSRAAAKAGADIIVNISASPYHAQKTREREAMLARRARANKVHVAYVNMVGGQDEIVFDGQSVVMDTKGHVLARAKAFEEALLVLDIPGKKGSIAATPSRQEEILQALITGTRDYVRKNGFSKVIIGLSGGIDSALVAAIAAQALGSENVTAAYMPSRYSSQESLRDARALARNLGIALQEVPIDDVFAGYLSLLKPHFAALPSGIAEENLQARIRGSILMAFSNKFGWLVLTTGNKSETSVGYCTLYGDMAGGFAVIKDLFKEEVYRLAGHINARAGNTLIPESVLTKEPTAELRANQKDSDSLPPYPQLDPVLAGYIEQNLGTAQMLKQGRDAALVHRVIRLVDGSEYKRRQAPPGIKITPLALGKDRRYPITNRYHLGG